LWSPPAGTPKPVIETINRAIVVASKLPDHVERFTKLGVDLAVSTPEEFDALVKSDTERFTKLFGKAHNQRVSRLGWPHSDLSSPG